MATCRWMPSSWRRRSKRQVVVLLPSASRPLRRQRDGCLAGETTGPRQLLDPLFARPVPAMGAILADDSLVDSGGPGTSARSWATGIQNRSLPATVPIGHRLQSRWTCCKGIYDAARWKRALGRRNHARHVRAVHATATGKAQRLVGSVRHRRMPWRGIADPKQMPRELRLSTPSNVLKSPTFRPESPLCIAGQIMQD